MSEIKEEVQLTEEQYKEFRAYLKREKAAELLMELLVDMLAEFESKSEEAWDQIARLHGFKNGRDAHVQGFDMVMNNIERKTRLEPKK